MTGSSKKFCLPCLHFIEEKEEKKKHWWQNPTLVFNVKLFLLILTEVDKTIKDGRKTLGRCKKTQSILFCLYTNFHACLEVIIKNIKAVQAKTTPAKSLN